MKVTVIPITVRTLGKEPGKALKFFFFFFTKIMNFNFTLKLWILNCIFKKISLQIDNNFLKLWSTLVWFICLTAYQSLMCYSISTFDTIICLYGFKYSYLMPNNDINLQTDLFDL